MPYKKSERITPSEENPVRVWHLKTKKWSVKTSGWLQVVKRTTEKHAAKALDEEGWYCYLEEHGKKIRSRDKRPKSRKRVHSVDIYSQYEEWEIYTDGSREDWEYWWTQFNLKEKNNG